MKMYDLIEKKKRGGSFLAEEIAYMVRGFVVGDIPDYQMSAMLMAVYLKGMDDREVMDLTLEMAHSGDMVDLSPIEGIKADKRSTGGVGDKTTLMIGPIVAACGVKVTKTSGRGLGYIGGTVDKLESIPGFKTVIPRKEFSRIVNESGLALIGQSGNMVPIDKRLYVLRDVTTTVDSAPLITSSIISKKLAVGSDCVVLDVKTESGVFMKTPEGSISLTREMVPIGTLTGRCCRAFITNVDVPLGHVIDNSLEMEEAIETLKGCGPEGLTCVCLGLAANMLHIAGRGDMEQCRKIAQGAMEDGSALKCLKSMVESQGGDGRYVENPGLFHKAPLNRETRAPETGLITHMNIEGIGVVSVMLGAGRNKKEDTVDYSVGILLEKKYGDSMREGEIIVALYASHEELFGPTMEKFLAFYTLGRQMPESESLIFARISDAGVEGRIIEEKIPQMFRKVNLKNPSLWGIIASGKRSGTVISWGVRYSYRF